MLMLLLRVFGFPTFCCSMHKTLEPGKSVGKRMIYAQFVSCVPKPTTSLCPLSTYLIFQAISFPLSLIALPRVQFSVATLLWAGKQIE